ncbi:MAG TPA: transporter [Bryobacteraceae bacterium]|nr:transporter [Bryobacteraceae bacterium]
MSLSRFGRGISAPLLRLASCLFLLCCLWAGPLTAQELQPRAYIPTPVGVNFFGFSATNNRGGLLFDPSLPVEDGRVNANIGTFAFGQTLGVAGRTAQVLAVLPYVIADLDGRVSGTQQAIYRSGLADATFRYAMNLYGAPAMHLSEFRAYRQKTIIGASITANAPTGQYDPVRLINVGTNRWAFKPEIGVSHAVGKWTLEGAAGVWLFTKNPKFNGAFRRTQLPLGSLQAHLVRVLTRRTWLALDWTLYTGGRTNVNGRDNSDYLGNQRLGASFGIALTGRQSIKISYFNGVDTRIGSDIRSIGLSYNIIWLSPRS